MNILLIAFALPLATILLAIVLQKILKCPILVAIFFFAVYLIVVFAAFNASFLILAIVYTLLAFISAFLTKIICDFLACYRERKSCTCGCGRRRECETNPSTIINVGRSSGEECNCGESIVYQGENNHTNSNCGCNTNNLGTTTANVSGYIVPANSYMNGCGCGRYRR